MVKYSTSLILGFVCDEIEFSIEDKSIDACREAIFKPTGRGNYTFLNISYLNVFFFYPRFTLHRSFCRCANQNEWDCRFGSLSVPPTISKADTKCIKYDNGIKIINLPQFDYSILHHTIVMFNPYNRWPMIKQNNAPN